MPTTLKDIAAAAGVSIGTVERDGKVQISYMDGRIDEV